MRKLNLKKETLAELTGAELASVAGGYSGYTCLGGCGSDFQQCLTGLRCIPTLPNECLTGTTVDSLTC